MNLSKRFSHNRVFSLRCLEDVLAVNCSHSVSVNCSRIGSEGVLTLPYRQLLFSLSILHRWQCERKKKIEYCYLI